MNATMLMAPRLAEMGEFLRSQREKLRPNDVGLPEGGRRRTPGLRREEVAQLSGVSTTWYTWIEQGRDVSVSALALSRLADGLRLSHAERAYLFELAGKRDPDGAEQPAGALGEAVQACIQAIGFPTYALDQAWNAVGWNAAAERLFVGWLDKQANLLRFIFLEPAARRLIPDWALRARRVVAEFRADIAAHRNDEAIKAVVDSLRADSAEFARLWQQHIVLEREGGQRTFQHPEDGLLCFEQVTFHLASLPGIKVSTLVPLAFDSRRASVDAGVVPSP